MYKQTKTASCIFIRCYTFFYTTISWRQVSCTHWYQSFTQLRMAPRTHVHTSIFFADIKQVDFFASHSSVSQRLHMSNLISHLVGSLAIAWHFLNEHKHFEHFFHSSPHLYTSDPCDFPIHECSSLAHSSVLHSWHFWRISAHVMLNDRRKKREPLSHPLNKQSQSHVACDSARIG